ncbi:MAG: hypothetical protein ACYDBB_13280 [Armatimonadota bacterium]
MRRILLAVAMFAMLGTGMLAGSLLTPALRAEQSTAAGQNPGVGYNVPGLNAPLPGYYAVPPRWQITILPRLSRAETVILLLDTVTGESFVLRVDANVTSGFSWERVIKRGIP